MRRCLTKNCINFASTTSSYCSVCVSQQSIDQPMGDNLVYFDMKDIILISILMLTIGISVGYGFGLFAGHAGLFAGHTI